MTRPRISKHDADKKMIRAWDLLGAGFTQAEVARILGVDNGHVSLWRKKLHELHNSP